MSESKTILITGGAGFMGSNLVRYLFDKYPNYKIMVLDILTYCGELDNFPERILNSDRFSFWYGDVKNASLVNSLVSQSDVVCHLAAETHVTRSIFDNLIFFETDVLGTQAVANAVLKNSKNIERFIHVSTSEVYGTAQTPVIKEDEHPLLPSSPYASAKAGADRLVYSYWVTYQIPAIIVRPFNNYGPHQHLEKVIPRFITSCFLDEPLTIHGDGSARRDWLYVEDFCEAMDLLIHCDLAKVVGQVINLGTGRDLSIKEIAEMVVEKMQKPKSLITYTDDRPGQVFRHTASIEKARDLIGWQPKIKFEDGLNKTIEWYRTHSEWWKKRLWMRRVPIVTKDGKTIIH
ncbi:MAG: GDP-mannose 4,6-dehydratase [Patescibacteria group bacterium]|nr:GDP-mannose 4,6-dehydratase [Patescibacteria group bacterium]